jgi:hypothetical protein
MYGGPSWTGGDLIFSDVLFPHKLGLNPDRQTVHPPYAQNPDSPVATNANKKFNFFCVPDWRELRGVRHD